MNITTSEDTPTTSTTTPTVEFHPTELGNAERFVAKFGADVLYNHEEKKWYEWTGQVWAKDRTGGMRLRMEQIAKAIMSEAASAEDHERRAKLAKWAIQSESNHNLRSSLAVAQSKVPVLTEEFNQDIYLLNLNNGILDLRTGDFLDHHRENMLTKISPVDYDPAAKCPRWEQFLTEVMDAATISFLQRAAGYSLTGFTGEHCLFLLYGLGRNGKSVFLAALQHILGDYALQTDWQSFTVSRNGGVQIRNDIARLHGARFVAAVESEKTARLAESLIKTLTGGDKITARFLYHEAFEFHPQFKLWLATNHKPNVVGTDEAMWSRVKLIPFDVTIPLEKRDKHLLDKLNAEASGILNWALEGLRMYNHDGLSESRAVTSATAEYRQHSDTLGHFITARCVLSETARTNPTELYAAYRTWAEFAGEYYVMNEREFATALEERGIRRGRTEKARFWKGIGLLQ